MPNMTSTPHLQQDPQKQSRLYYLDWLQVLAVLGVFLFHALHPFDELGGWIIKDTGTTWVLNFFGGFFYPWGMPFFFFMAGAASWFSLKKRSAQRYARERFLRLLIPFVVGSIFLTPIQAFYEMRHKGIWAGDSLIEFIFNTDALRLHYAEVRPLIFGPEIFNRLGVHLWFVGFLFAFSLLALPIFSWLKRESGKRFAAWLAALANRRGGLLVFIIPLFLTRFILQQGTPSDDYGWVDFIYFLIFFIAGFIIMANENFARVIRRDWRLNLALGIICTSFLFSVAADVPIYDWMVARGPMFYTTWTLWALNSWCWTLVMLYIGMRFLNKPNNWLEYCREATYPFFFVHQPVIVFIAFYAVQWEVHLPIKLLVVVIGSFVLSLGACTPFVRFNPLRALFGMKPKQKKTAPDVEQSIQ